MQVGWSNSELPTFSGFRRPVGTRCELAFRCLTSSSEMSPRNPSSDTKSLEDRKMCLLLLLRGTSQGLIPFRVKEFYKFKEMYLQRSWTKASILSGFWMLIYLDWNGVQCPFSWPARQSFGQLCHLDRSRSPPSQSRHGVSQHALAASLLTDCGCHPGDQMASLQHPHSLRHYLNDPRWERIAVV